MTGEIAFHGVFVPTLLLLAVIALVLTMGAVRLAALVGLYRFFAYRALVDLCLFVLILGLVVLVSPLFGFQQ